MPWNAPYRRIGRPGNPRPPEGCQGMKTRLAIAILMLASPLQGLRAEGPWPAEARAFIKSYCLNCHDGETAAERPSSAAGAGFESPVRCSVWFGVPTTQPDQILASRNTTKFSHVPPSLNSVNTKHRSSDLNFTPDSSTSSSRPA